MSGSVTDKDIREYCTRDPGGDAAAHGMAWCLADTAKQASQPLYAEADCSKARIKVPWGPRYSFAGLDETRNPLWRDLTDGKTIESFPASGGDTVTAEFTMLCPAASKQKGFN
jgi:hypothetical protein